MHPLFHARGRSAPLPGFVARIQRSHRTLELLDVREAAAALRVSKMTVYRLVHDGRLRAVRVTPGGEEPLLAGGEAHLQVVDCEKIAPLSHVHGEVRGLSAVGFQFATTAPLRAGDRLRFHRRYFAEMVGAPNGDVARCWRVSGASSAKLVFRYSSGRPALSRRVTVRSW